MKFPNNDLWTVRQIELLEGALEDMRGKNANYYPTLPYHLTIPDIAEYQFKGVLCFNEDDRTIMFEEGDNFGVSYEEIIDCLKRYGINYVEIANKS